MNLRTCNTFLGAACAFAIAHATSCLAASMSDVPPPLQKMAQCMLTALKQVPSVDQAKMGLLSGGGWVHPYLEFRTPPDKDDGERQIVRFEAQKSHASGHDSYVFEGILKDVFKKNEAGPNFHGTGRVSGKWRSACGVDSYVDWTS